MSIKSLTMLTRVADTKVARKSIIPALIEKPSCFIDNESTKIEHSTLYEAGLSSKKIADFVEELYKDDSCNPHNLMIVKNGKIAFETYFGTQKKGIWKATFSACKSITSIAIGMLIDDGKLKITDKLESIFDKEMSAIAKARMKGMTVYDLLTMTSGMKIFEETSILTEKDPFKAYISTPLSYNPKEKFVYNSTNTYILSAIVKKISGKCLFDFLKVRLFEPLGIKKIFWQKAPDGNDYGGFGLYIMPEDFAKIAIMMLNGGVYDGKQILSRKYINDATSRHIKTDKHAYRYDYGYQIWTGRNNNEYLFNGMLGQNVLTIKDKGIIIISNCGNDDNYQQGNFFDYVNKYFYDSLMYKPTLIESSKLKNVVKKIAENRLLAFTDKNNISKINNGEIPSNLDKYIGKTLATDDKRKATMSIMPFTWQAVENNYSKGFVSLSFREENKKLVMNYKEIDQEFDIPIGFNKPEYTEIKIHGVPFAIGVYGGVFINDNLKEIFKIQIDFLETPCSTIFMFYKKGNKYKMYQKDIPGCTFVETGILMSKEELSQNKLIAPATNLLRNEDVNFLVERLFEIKVELKEI